MRKVLSFLYVLLIAFGWIGICSAMGQEISEGADSQTLTETTVSESAAEPVIPETDTSDTETGEANTETADSAGDPVSGADAGIVTGDPDAPDARVIIPDDNPVEETAGTESEIIPKVDETLTEGPKADADTDKSETHKNSGNINVNVEIPIMGFPTAQTALKEMYTDMINGLNTRQIMPLYQKWQRYNLSVRQRTARASTSELNGRCRLPWYEKLYQDPLVSIFDVEEFSSAFMRYSTANTNHLIQAIRLGREKMNITVPQEKVYIPEPKTADEAITQLKMILERSANAYTKAMATLKPNEVKVLASELYPIFCSQVINGHTIPNRSRGKYLVDLMLKIDQKALYDATEILLPLVDENFREQFSKIASGQYESVKMGDQIVQRIPTAAGDILIGGREDNVWDLDSYSSVICIIDLGGNDTYKEGSCNINRPLLVVIDLGSGNDLYTGVKPGIQGSSILGISLWYNERGNNVYQARSVAQGSTIGGVGILIDGQGDDQYLGTVRAQGSALCGLGLLVDQEGSDDYRAALLAQGLGHPGGFGCLVDKDGNDHYYVGGYFTDAYPEHPGYDGWGQGIGAGIRQVACGGIGMILDGGGDDVYEFDYFAHGGGYWMGTGIARDFDGNDKRLAATLTAFNKGPRHEGRWQRFGSGFGCHYAVGYLIDDAGNDVYNGTIMGVGMGWDLAAGFLIDFAGDDSFEATGGYTQGTGAEGSIGVLMNYRGNDTYRGANQGHARSYISYHSAYDCGANFSFVIDHGGNDVYGSRVPNDSMSYRGSSGGFVIDRPTEVELAEKQKAEAEAVARGEKPKQETKTTHSSYPPQQQPQYQSQPQNNQPGWFGNGRWRLFGG